MICRTRFPVLWSLLVGEDVDAAEKREARQIRRKALEDLQLAQHRRDTRKAHEKAKKAVEATCNALKAGA